MIDYVDRNVPVLANMFEKRMKGYQAMGYSVDDDTVIGHEQRGDSEQRQMGLI